VLPDPRTAQPGFFQYAGFEAFSFHRTARNVIWQNSRILRRTIAD
jgi:hypothetical protein